MKLKDYLNGLPRGQKGSFAAQVGIDPVYLSQIASEDHGERRFRPSPALAVRIEQVSEKAVTRVDLRPEDWQDIWPELTAVPTSQLQPATETVADVADAIDQPGALRTGTTRRQDTRRQQDPLINTDRRAKGGPPFQCVETGVA